MSDYQQVVDNILTEWAYRVSDGMPVMENPDHKSILYDVIYDLDYGYILEEKKEEDIKVHKGQNPTTFYHEVLTALAVSGIDMNKINSGDDMKKYMGSKVKAGVPGKEFKNYPQKKYMENSTHDKFGKLKTDAISLANTITKDLGNSKGTVWWAGPTNDNSDYGASDIVADFQKYKDVGVSLKYEKGQLKNLTVNTLGQVLNLKDFSMENILKKYKREFDGMTKDWNILILKEFKKQVNSNRDLDNKQKKEAISLLQKLQRQSNTWEKYQKLKVTQDESDILTNAVGMKKHSSDSKKKFFRYICRKFQETQIGLQWREWSDKRNKRWDTIFGGAFRDNEKDIDAGLVGLFQKQLSIGKKDMFYAANAGKTFWFIPGEERFEDLVKDLTLSWNLKNTGSGYEFILSVNSSITGKHIADINVVTRYTQGQMDGIGSKSNYKLYADDWTDIFGDWR